LGRRILVCEGYLGGLVPTFCFEGWVRLWW